MMDKPLYYLAHPFGGKLNNMAEVYWIEAELSSIGIVTINPVGILPHITDNEERAIEKCRLLFDVCDALILSGNWKRSPGCLREIRWAEEKGIPIYEYKDKQLKPFKKVEIIE